jgi:hypothetical protein
MNPWLSAELYGNSMHVLVPLLDRRSPNNPCTRFASRMFHPNRQPRLTPALEMFAWTFPTDLDFFAKKVRL